MGQNGCLEGFWTPDGGDIPTLYSTEVDRILYSYHGATKLGIKTFQVPRNKSAVTEVTTYKKVDPYVETSDHRPRKITLPI